MLLKEDFLSLSEVQVTYLAFVSSLISLLDKLYVKDPLVSVLCPHDVEALVSAVGEDTRRQDVIVSSSNPRHLKNEEF